MNGFISGHHPGLGPFIGCIAASVAASVLLFSGAVVTADPAGTPAKSLKLTVKKSVTKAAAVKPKPSVKKLVPSVDKSVDKADRAEKADKESDDSPPVYDDKDPDESKYNVEERDPTGDHYTSVIIDASSYHVTPSMSPKICRTDSTKVWPNLPYIDPDYVISYGIVVYAHSLEEARSHKRAGKNPLILRATGHGASSDDPILSDTDADLLLAANKHNRCVDKFKVIFILDTRMP